MSPPSTPVLLPKTKYELARQGFLVFLFTVLVFSSSAQTLDPQRCYEATLSQHLLWVTSGVAQEGMGALVVDTIADEVLQLQYNGGVSLDVDPRIAAFRESIAPSSTWRPRKIKGTDDGYLLLRLDEANRHQFVRMDSSVEFPGAAVGTGFLQPRELLAVWDFAVMGDGILALADFEISRNDSTQYQTAFVYLDPSEGTAKFFYRMSVHSDDVNPYTTLNVHTSFLATIGETGYILFFDEKPWIGRVEADVDGVQRLDFFPESFGHFPRLSTRSDLAAAGLGAKQATLFHRILERSKIPAGLYAQGDYLYILGKEPMDGNGQTEWWVIQLDPQDGSELGRINLPTNAALLTVVQGADFWNLIEKGQVRALTGDPGDYGYGAPYMRTASMVSVPASWFDTSPGAKPLQAVSRPPCAPLVARY